MGCLLAKPGEQYPFSSSCNFEKTNKVSNWSRERTRLTLALHYRTFWITDSVTGRIVTCHETIRAYIAKVDDLSHHSVNHTHSAGSTVDIPRLVLLQPPHLPFVGLLLNYLDLQDCRTHTSRELRRAVRSDPRNRSKLFAGNQYLCGKSYLFLRS